jgi:hypothetical protein
MKQKYFVAYDFWEAKNIHGVGSTIIERETPVSGWDDIKNMMDVILSRNSGMTAITISNWRRFEDSE